MIGFCAHKSLVYVPKEDDPAVLAEVCRNCLKVLGTVGHEGDTSLEEIGRSLGDPDEDV